MAFSDTVNAGLVDTTDNAMVELIAQDEFDQCKRIHDEIEQFLYNNPSDKLKEGYMTSRRSHVLTTFTEMAVVDQNNLATYVNNQSAELATQQGLLSPQAQAKLASDLRRVLLTSQSSDCFHRIEVQDALGGIRIFEKFLFRQKRLENGDVAILFSYFGDKQTLAHRWQYLVANHDAKKITRWLEFKLFENLMAKGRSLMSPRSYLGRNTAPVAVPLA